MLAFGRGAINVTKSDSVVYTPPLQGLYIGGAGNVTIVDQYGNISLFTAPPVGTLLPVAVSQVMSTNTTATAIVGIL